MSDFGKNGKDVFRKTIELHICAPYIYSCLNQGRGAFADDVYKKNKQKNTKKKKGISYL